MKTEVRTARIELADPFAGFYLIVRTNPPMRVFRALASGNIEKTLAAYAALSIESNLTDEQDQPIDVTTSDGWAEMTSEVLEAVAEKIGEAMKAPKASANGSTTRSLAETAPYQPTSTT